MVFNIAWVISGARAAIPKYQLHLLWSHCGVATSMIARLNFLSSRATTFSAASQLFECKTTIKSWRGFFCRAIIEVATSQSCCSNKNNGNDRRSLTFPPRSLTCPIQLIKQFTFSFKRPHSFWHKFEQWNFDRRSLVKTEP